jgi:hypothetical protein
VKLAEVDESRLEAAREPRLDVRDPGLLPEDRDCMLLERLGRGEGEKKREGERGEKGREREVEGEKKTERDGKGDGERGRK